MTKKTIQSLLAGAARAAECKAKRAAWVRAGAAALRDAQREMDERLGHAVDRLSAEEFDRLCDEEEAKVELFRGPLKAAAERDMWPRELYFGGI